MCPQSLNNESVSSALAVESENKSWSVVSGLGFSHGLVSDVADIAIQAKKQIKSVNSIFLKYLMSNVYVCLCQCKCDLGPRLWLGKEGEDFVLAK